MSWTLINSYYERFCCSLCCKYFKRKDQVVNYFQRCAVLWWLMCVCVCVCVCVWILRVVLIALKKYSWNLKWGTLVFDRFGYDMIQKKICGNLLSFRGFTTTRLNAYQIGKKPREGSGVVRMDPLHFLAVSWPTEVLFTCLLNVRKNLVDVTHHLTVTSSALVLKRNLQSALMLSIFHITHSSKQYHFSTLVHFSLKLKSISVYSLCFSSASHILWTNTVLFLPCFFTPSELAENLTPWPWCGLRGQCLF